MSAALPPPEADQPSPADELAGSEQPFVAHLIELRDRLLYSIYGVIVALIALALYPGPARLMDWVAAPIRAHMPADAKLIATGVLSPFIVPLKVLAIAALLLALPWIMFQAWRFVAPGLYKHEKRFVLPLILLGSFLAYAGIAFVQINHHHDIGIVANARANPMSGSKLVGNLVFYPLRPELCIANIVIETEEAYF